MLVLIPTATYLLSFILFSESYSLFDSNFVFSRAKLSLLQQIVNLLSSIQKVLNMTSLLVDEQTLSNVSDTLQYSPSPSMKQKGHFLFSVLCLRFAVSTTTLLRSNKELLYFSDQGKRCVIFFDVILFFVHNF